MSNVMSLQRPNTVFLLDRTYDEVYALLLEARSYMAHIAPMLRQSLKAEDRLFVTYQSTRLTSRLLEMMSWLMAQRAIHKQEITLVDAMKQGFIISNDAVCAPSDEEESALLPEGLRDLLDRSAKIYARLHRLDDQMRKAA